MSTQPQVFSLNQQPSPALTTIRRVLSSEPLRAADRIARLLADSGVEVVFSLPGAPISPLNDALLDIASIRSVTVRHENNAMFAAAGYARTSGKLGVVIVTSGPGALNGMTGLASAFCDDIPLLVLVGEVRRELHGKNALQDGEHLQIRSIFGSLSKWTAEIPDPDAAVPMIAHGMHVAMTGRRGPVALTLPMDVLLGPASQISCIVDCTEPTDSTDSRCLAPASMSAVVQAIERSRSGVIFAGSGVRRGTGPHQLLTLAEYLQWPVMTTPRAKGVFPETHPLSLGVFGMAGHRSAHGYVERGVDTVLAVGTSLGELATNGWSRLLCPRRALIQADVDISHMGQNYAADIAIAAPADLFMGELSRTLRPRLLGDELPVYGVERFADPRALGDGPEGYISPVRAIWEIQEFMPDDAIFCIDIGAHSLFSIHYLRIDRPDSFVIMHGLGSMASSISGLGAKLARPDRPVAVICGDGGFAMMATEVTTAVQHGVEMVFFVFNNQCLGMVEHGHTRAYGRTPNFSTAPLDVPGLARSVGARAATVRHADELLALDLDALLDGGPLVVDVRIDRRVHMPQNQRFATLAGASRAPRRLPAEVA